jgi:hypothetical protein
MPDYVVEFMPFINTSQRLFGSEGQDLAELDLGFIPFEDECAAWFKDSEALCKSLAQVATPIFPKLSIFGRKP